MPPRRGSCVRKRWAETTKPWRREAAASAVGVALETLNATAGWQQSRLDRVVPALAECWAVETLGSHHLLAARQCAHAHTIHDARVL
jgi:hypothetical protein